MQGLLARAGAAGTMVPLARSADSVTSAVGPLPRIAFLFNAQAHQILHGITVAERLALDWQVNVDILSASPDHLTLARRLTDPQSHCLLRFDLIGAPVLRRAAAAAGSVVPPKLLTLLHARRRLDGYDAIALPERTSTILRSFGVGRPMLIHLDHGAGDRAAGFDPRIARFDFALVAGEKQRCRMLADGLIRPGDHAVVGYPKFEAADRSRRDGWTPFADKRPIILYNPHFSKALGSWPRHGAEIVRRIAEDGRFNLIVAPHVRMCDSRKRRAAFLKSLAPASGLPNVHIDPGSDRSIDMSYTMMADIYLGDVSSQIYEFLRTPRPCLFFNGDGRSWRDDPDHAHWRFGPVVEDAALIMPAIDYAIESHGDFAAGQRQGFVDTFDLHEGESHSKRAAEAIAAFLRLQPHS
ncbi:hypothetical protein ASE00_05795 [Sphingomonas sp. Root710]|nr:hypothetical protein ASE00_05795 [Sphingomonas sp. Root710]